MASFGKALAVAMGALLVGASLGSAVQAQEVSAAAPADAATIYGRLPAYEMMSLSPDGRRLAFITVVGEARSLLVVDPATGALLGGSRAGDAKVRDVSWVGNDHVLVVMTSTEAIPNIGVPKGEQTYGELYDIPKRQLRRVLGGTSGVAPILMGMYSRTIDGRPKLFVTTAVFERGGFEGYGLYDIDLSTGRGRLVENQGNRLSGFVVDELGKAIARSQYYSDTGRWVLSLRQGNFWRESWSTVAPLDQPYLSGLGVSPGAFVIHAARDGEPAGYHQVDATTGVWSKLPFSREPDSLLRNPVTGLVTGAAYTQGDEIEREYLDPASGRTWRSVQAAFSGRHPVIEATSDTLRQAVVHTWSATDAGSYHFVDLDAGSASEVGPAYPEVTAVGEVRSIRYKARDGMDIPGYLTLPPGVSDPRDLPLVVLPHGGPAARDTLRFDWWAQALASKGYAVLQPNFRGSDGLADAHLTAGYGEWGAKMQTDLSDGVRFLADQGMIDPVKVCIVGASYGGYAALAGPTLDPGVYRCAVSVAGVSDLRAMVDWSGGGSGAGVSPTVRYWNRFMGADAIGRAGLDARSPRLQAEKADAPILLLHGIDDTVVPFEQSRVMAAALERANKPYELIRLGGEDHWLSRPQTRQRMLAETIRWLDTHNPAQ